MSTAEQPPSRMRSFFRRRAQTDEIQALYREHGPTLLLYGRSILGRRHAAEDMLHQVFLELLDQNTVPEDPKSYLFRAIHNRALNQIRHERQNVDLAVIEPWFEADTCDPASEVALRAGLQQLTVEQRQTLVLHVWGGFTFAEIAGMLDIPANTAASRYRYALQNLRAVMLTKDPTCP